MVNGIQFQSVQTPNALSSELRSVIRDNVLQFYVQGNGMDVQEEGITALYERLSQEDKLDGESNSIANQKKILERYCKDHGYTANRHYDEDDGYSGTNFNRPGFQRMLERYIPTYIENNLKNREAFFVILIYVISLVATGYLCYHTAKCIEKQDFFR